MGGHKKKEGVGSKDLPAIDNYMANNIDEVCVPYFCSI